MSNPGYTIFGQASVASSDPRLDPLQIVSEGDNLVWRLTRDMNFWFSGNGAPTSTNQLTGDLYYDVISGTAWRFQNNGWVEVAFAVNPAGVDGDVQYNNGGFFGGDASFTFDKTTGNLSVSTINKLTITPSSTGSTLTIADGKTLTVDNRLEFAGTDGTKMTFPTTSATIARTDAGNTFIGHQTIEGVTSTGATGNGNLVFATAPTISGLLTAQGNIQLGVAGSVSGVVTLEGSTSGSASITAPATAGTLTNPITFSNAITTPAINTILYADHFPGVDIGAKINAAVAALPTVSSKPYGTIAIASGSYSFSTPIVITSPFVFIEANFAQLTYTGTSGVALTFDDAPTSYTGQGGLRNFYLTGNASAGLVGVKVQEVTWIKFENVTIANFTGAGSIGLLLANVSNWTEQGDYDHVNLDFNTIGMAFQDNHAGNTGAPSFAYTRIRDMVITVPPSGVGMKLQNDANMNGCDIEVSFFGGSSSTLLQLLSTSNIIGSRIKLTGEKSAGATSITGVSTAAGTVLQTQLWEFWNSDQITDSLSGTSIYYASTPVPGYTSIFTAANGYQVQANGNNFSGTFDVHNITNFRTWTLPDASGNVTLDSATQNLTNKTFGIAGASSGVLTLAGSTSDSCTITAPAVAGTVTNPIAFSNSINLNGASCVYQTNGVAGVSHASSDYTAFTFNGGIVTALTASSDERLKTDIKPFAYGLDAILAIDPVSYHWNELGHKHGGCNTDVEYAGFIAQNVQKAIPTAITGTEGDEKYLCLDTRAIISALVNSVKELKAEIELLKSK